jgi:hypothetical protein
MSLAPSLRGGASTPAPLTPPVPRRAPGRGSGFTAARSTAGAQP